MVRWRGKIESYALRLTRVHKIGGRTVEKRDFSSAQVVGYTLWFKFAG